MFFVGPRKYGGTRTPSCQADKDVIRTSNVCRVAHDDDAMIEKPRRRERSPQGLRMCGAPAVQKMARHQLTLAFHTQAHNLQLSVSTNVFVDPKEI
jgi:hypothetical protein